MLNNQKYLMCEILRKLLEFRISEQTESQSQNEHYEFSQLQGKIKLGIKFVKNWK